MNALIAYVKNVVIKNNLATEDQFSNALDYLDKNPDANILKALLKLELISKEQALKIKSGFETYQAKKKSDVEIEKDAAPIPRPPMPETIVHSERICEIDNKNEYVGKTLLGQILTEARNKGASDVHVVSGAPIMMRLNGSLIPMNDKLMNNEKAREVILGGLNSKQISAFSENNFLETCLVLEGEERYRTCIVNQHRGIDGSFRIISKTIPTLAQLGLPAELQKLTTFATGIIFLTGPSGTGKSSTMAALVELINQEREDHIITLEDPIEFVYESKKCHISQRQLYDHTESFSAALRGALREDPDVIILGEMRDYETASLALTAAETGHLVMTTLHTTSAVKTIERVLDMFPPDKVSQIRTMLSKSLRAVICQKLIPKADGNGRIAALEIMYNNNPVSNLIATDKMIAVPSTMQTSKSEGMVLMDVYIQELLSKGLIKAEDALKAVEDKKKITVKKSVRG